MTVCEHEPMQADAMHSDAENDLLLISEHLGNFNQRQSIIND
jgi:hypothetical protein